MNYKEVIHTIQPFLQRGCDREHDAYCPTTAPLEFNDFVWHDSSLRNIKIDRTQPGEQDTIEFEIEFDDGLYQIVFESVYWASFQMNFGVQAIESIYFAHQEGPESELVQDFYKSRKGFLDGIPLNYYEIETNSTGSKLQIIAKGFTYKILE